VSQFIQIAKNWALLVSLLGLFIVPGKTKAATVDGSEGVTSTATYDVYLAIGDVIRIWGLTDIDFGTWSGAGNLNRTQNIRVNVNYGTNDATRRYEVTANGDHASGDFLLENLSGQTLPYTAWFNDELGNGGQVELSPGVTLTGQDGAHFPLRRAARSASIRVRINQADLQAADGGEYTGHIILFVQPE
jgi:hypothetical protein